jgi:hypothetical protein
VSLLRPSWGWQNGKYLLWYPCWSWCWKPCASIRLEARAFPSSTRLWVHLT